MIFRTTYSSSQTDLDIITPSSGKRIYIWEIYINAENGATLEFADSEINVENLSTSYPNSAHKDVHKEGAIGEALTLTCGANTTIAILYEELE